MPKFVEDRSQDTLFVNGSLESLLPATSDARLIWQVLTDLDFGVFEARYRNEEAGRPAIDPRCLAAVWLLALLRGTTSSVQVAALCASDIEFRWLLGDAPVQESTLCDFRKNYRSALLDLSQQVLVALSRAGLLPGDALGTDGTMLRAAASCGASRTREKLEKHLGRLRNVLEERLDGPEEPDDVEAQLEKRAQRIQRGLEEMTALGLNGEKDRMTLTEPDAPLRKLKNGSFGPAHNIQVTADLKTGVVIHTDVVARGNDRGQLGPQVEAAQALLEQVKATHEDVEAGPGPVRAVVADSMYHDTRQIVALEERGVEAFVPDRQEGRRPPGVSDDFLPRAFAYDPQTDTMCCPAGHVLRRRKLNNNKTAVTYQARKRDCRNCPHKHECCPKTKSGRYVNRPLHGALLDKTAKRLKTPRGKRHRQARSVAVEGVFARMTDHLHWRRCRTWGADGARAEALWRQLLHNIMLLSQRWSPLVLRQFQET